MKNQLVLLICLLTLTFCQSPDSEGGDTTNDDPNQVEEVNAEEESKKVPDAAQVTFKAQGNEPFWSVEILGEEAIRYTSPETKVVFPFVPPILSPSSNPSEVYAAKTTEHELRMVIYTDEACSDTMSDEDFPNTVEITFNGQKKKGCGRPVTQ